MKVKVMAAAVALATAMTSIPAVAGDGKFNVSGRFSIDRTHSDTESTTFGLDGMGFSFRLMEMVE